MFATIPINAIDQYIESGAAILLVDLRTANEYALGHIKGAVNLPYKKRENWVKSLPRDRKLVFYCERGGQSMMICRYLDRMGYQAVDTVGGLCQYRGKYLEQMRDWH